MYYAVVDVETTGIGARTNEIVEIAIVAMGPEGQTEWAFSSLVNPQRDVGPTRIHGVRASDVRDAPTFADLSGRIAQLLSRRLIVAHNSRFDVDFLEASFAKMGVDDVPLPHLCTMHGARQVGIRPTKLSDVCDYMGITNPYPHQALGDAMATAEIWKRMLPHSLPESIAAAEAEVASMPLWPDLQIRTVDGFPRPKRPTAAPSPTAKGEPAHDISGSIDVMVRKAHKNEASYMAAVQSAVEDRLLDAAEAGQLNAFGEVLHLSIDEREGLHREVLRAQAATAWADGAITESERLDMYDLAKSLGLKATDADAALKAPQHVPVHHTRQLQAGDRVVFTGDMDTPRSELKAATESVGLRVTGSVSGKTAALICADSATQSGKANAARDKSVRIISEHSFMRLLKALDAGK